MNIVLPFGKNNFLVIASHDDMINEPGIRQARIPPHKNSFFIR
jgi:hypothetical protein